MSIGERPICEDCKHLDEDLKGYACSAFPAGIPEDIIMGDIDHHKPTLGDNGIQFEAKEEEKVAKIESYVPITKLDDDKQIVYGPVLVPGEVDSQGDIVTKEEIERVAHNFMLKLQKSRGEKGIIGKQHTDIEFGKHGYVVESFIDPNGVWMLGTKVEDADTWAEIKKGEITGYSIGGVGARTPLSEEEVKKYSIEKSEGIDNPEQIAKELVELVSNLLKK